MNLDTVRIALRQYLTHHREIRTALTKLRQESIDDMLVRGFRVWLVTRETPKENSCKIFSTELKALEFLREDMASILHSVLGPEDADVGELINRLQGDPILNWLKIQDDYQLQIHYGLEEKVIDA